MVHDRPRADELVAAVREFLETDVLGQVEGRVGFHTRVAINVLSMVERELDRGDDPQADHERRLADLGQRDQEGLALSIRDGSLDGRMDEVFEVVRAEVATKLEVANPRYLRSGS